MWAVLESYEGVCAIFDHYPCAEEIVDNTSIPESMVEKVLEGEHSLWNLTEIEFNSDGVCNSF